MAETMRQILHDDRRAAEFVACMAMDAFRLALGNKPIHFTTAEIVLWLTNCR
jgi:hypothetical protein